MGVMLGCCALGGSLISATAYEGNTQVLTTKTVTFDTSYRTRFTSELSAPDAYLGGSIAFDLLDSDMKDAYNVTGEGALTPSLAGVQNIDFNNANAYITAKAQFAGINFNFFKKSDAMTDVSWRAGDYSATTGADELPGSFTYYADGRVVEYSGAYTYGNATATNRLQKVRSVGEDGFVGTSADVNAFMNEGYSYKVSWVWGTVNSDKSVTYAPAGVHSEAWYVAYQKPLDASDKAYTMLFAFRVTNPQKVRSTSGNLAGFEITANSACRRNSSGKNNFSNHARNVKMELDNIAIYDGYDYNLATKKVRTGFEGSYADLPLSTAENLKQGTHLLSDYGQYGGDPSSSYFDNHIVETDGIKIQSTNAVKELIQAIAKRSVNTKNMYSVEYVNQATNTLVCRRDVYEGAKPTTPTIEEAGFQAYNWTNEPTAVTQNTVVYGMVDPNGLEKYEVTFGDGITATYTKAGETTATPITSGQTATQYSTLVFTIDLPVGKTITSATYNGEDVLSRVVSGRYVVQSLTGNANFVVTTADASKSVLFDTSYRTRATAQLSAPDAYLGGSIEFDLLYSDLKDEYNISGQGPSVAVGAQSVKFDDTTTWALRRINLASINFNFFKASDEMTDYSWRVGEGGTENQAASFSYYADGTIVEYSGAPESASTRMQRTHSVGDETFVGTQADVHAFMTAGYTYKVSWVWGTVNENKQITYAQDGAHSEAWYVVWQKSLEEPVDGYDILFAFKVSNPQKVGAQSGTYAGFEISANSGLGRNNQGAGYFSNHSKNVKMEMDNIAIYDGYNYATATKKAKTGFENHYAELTLSTADGLQSGPHGVGDYGGYYGGNASSQYFDNYIVETDGVKIQSTNAVKELIVSPAKRTIITRKIYKVEFSNGTDIVQSSYIPEGFDASLPNYTIGGVYYRWNTPGVDLDDITENVLITGAPTDTRYVLYHAGLGEGTIEKNEAAPNASVTLSDGTGFTRERYKIIGWSLYDDDTVDYELSASFTVPERDVTLYAVWQLLVYDVTFVQDGVTLQTVKVESGDNAYYTGEIPKKEGSTFIGWDALPNAITENKTFTAVFSETYDEYLNYATVSTSVNANEKAEEIAFVRYLPAANRITIVFDLVQATGNAKVYFGTGAEKIIGGKEIDISSYLHNYITVKIVADKYTYAVYTKALDAGDNEYKKVASNYILKARKAGFAGIWVEIPKSVNFTMEVGNVQVYENDNVYRDTMQWQQLDLQAGETMIIGSLTSVYASKGVSFTKTQRAREYNVDFKADSQTVATRKCWLGGTATAPTVDGYTYDFTTQTNVTANKTITGNGVKNSYTLTFVADGYTFEDITYTYGEKVTLPTAKNQEQHFVIVGWATQENAKNPTWKAGEEVELVSGNLTLYPVWALEEFVVKFFNEDGTLLYETKVSYNASATYVGEKPEKAGFVFNGWDKNPTSVRENMSVTATFVAEEKPTYQVMVTNGSGSGKYAAGETVVINYDEVEGYSFEQWLASEELTFTKTENGYSFVMCEKDVTITAQMKENVTFTTLLRDWVVVGVAGGVAIACALVFVIKKRKNG